LKSKIIAITVALALVLSLVFAVAVPVAASSGWNVSGNWVFDFILTGSNVDNYYNVTFAQTGTAITGTGGYPMSGPPYQYTWNITGAVISGINFTATYTSGATGTVMQVTGTIAPNGSMSGTWSDNYGGVRTGTWSTKSGQATPMPDLGNMVITGTIVAPTVTVTAPAAYTWTLFKVGGNWSTDDTGSVVVTENSANTTNWQVVAQDVSATDYGFMRDGSNNALATKFEISKANANSGLTYAINGITYTGTDNGSFDFYGYQNVTNGDTAGTYSITITFTATVTSYN